MIPLKLAALAEHTTPFVTRLRVRRTDGDYPIDSFLVSEDETGTMFSGKYGLLAIDGASGRDLDGDVVLMNPGMGRIDRLLRSGSAHNSLLITEQCDQLCVMCSQPPKKHHDDRFSLLEQACLVAETDAVITLSGGEPTLHKKNLFGLIERVLAAREDVAFHVLTNAQHFEPRDTQRLRDPRYRRVTWGVPLYASSAALHDRIVGKEGAFKKLEAGLAILMLAGAGVELRTVVLKNNVAGLGELAHYVDVRLGFCGIGRSCSSNI